MKTKQRTTLKNTILYTAMTLSMVFLMGLLLLHSWQNKIKSQKLDQSMSRKVSRENAETPGPKGKKRPKGVPETSGDFFMLLHLRLVQNLIWKMIAAKMLVMYI